MNNFKDQSKSMKKSLLLLTALILLLWGCSSKASKKEGSPRATSEALVGNYVSDGYNKRSEGYDWVAVSITALTDSTAHVAVRSRSDIKKPTCRFDADATLAGKDTLKAVYEGKGILFTLAGNKLTIAAENEADSNLLYFFCSGGASLAGEYTKIEGALDEKQIDQRSFDKVLSLQDISFDVTAQNNELTIQPIGLTVDNSKVTQNIEGYTVTNAEIGDLNADGYPEVLVYLNSVGSGSYGMVIGYSVNNGKSMSQISFPNITDNPEASKGYMGHDEFAIVELSFCQRFPIYKENDTNANPTGGTRQIQYKLKDGEASRKFVVDKVISY
ncbi:PliI family lysozyme inhibitor of I-type lysozyme [Bacteroides sp.]|uniref:PliI family lysozyme inhibitor of I-type lysozyme n=1 Tax=Bacteroides sp. TaxID=29523 RepID=UPI002FCABBCD